MMPAGGGLYALLDTATVARPDCTAAAEAAVDGGARLLQYRDKPRADIATARALAGLARARGIALIVNDDPALAAAAGAHGVHLGQDDPDPARAREYLGAQAIVGVTCHASLELAERAVAAGADYVSFGRFFASRTKPGAPAADSAVLGAARGLGVPIVAIGGVDADNGGSLLAAGADWLAASHAVFGATDVREAARRLAALCRTHRSDK